MQAVASQWTPLLAQLMATVKRQIKGHQRDQALTPRAECGGQSVSLVEAV